MPTMVIKPGATVFVTGVNGLIGSHVVDQLLALGYNVRGAVRSVEKTGWLKEYFDNKHPQSKFDLVEVSDMTSPGCYDGLLEGCSGFIHVAAPVGGIRDLQRALTIGRSAGINALEACAKTPSVTRFVNTSSMFAATLPRPDLEQAFIVDQTMYNDEALKDAESDTPMKGILVYAAAKSETEKAMWKWMGEHKPGFVMNTILPNANFGPVLVPEHQGYPSTIDWARASWTGENLELYAERILPQWFISLRDDALLHISALIHSDVSRERLFGCAERWSHNQVLAIYRKKYPGRKFPEDVEGLGVDRVVAPTARAEDVLGWVKGSGWDGLEESVVAMTKDW